MLRSFDSSGSPEIEIEVRGMNQAAQRGVTAIVDTGFTGFFLLPLHLAVQLNLVPDSSIDVTLADGSVHNKLVALGGLRFEDQTCAGIMILEEQNTDPLVGMEFLRSFGLTMILDAVAGTLELRRNDSNAR